MSKLFEWDPKKRRSTIKKHGVDFIEATEIFRDKDRVSKVDTRFTDEKRELSVGMSSKQLLQVAHTERGKKTRIITAFPASDKGRKWYQFNLKNKEKD